MRLSWRSLGVVSTRKQSVRAFKSWLPRTTEVKVNEGSKMNYRCVSDVCVNGGQESTSRALPMGSGQPRT